MSGMPGEAGAECGGGKGEGDCHRLAILLTVRCALPYFRDHPQPAATKATPLVSAVGYPALRRLPYLYTGKGYRGIRQPRFKLVIDSSGNIF